MRSCCQCSAAACRRSVAAAAGLSSSSLLGLRHSAVISSSSSLLATSSSGCSSSMPSSSSSTFTMQRRHQTLTNALPSAVMGAVKPLKGYFSKDVHIDISNFGGQFARGLFAKRHIPYGQEIIRVPAFATYIGDEPQREQVFILTQQILGDLVAKGDADPTAKYVSERVFTMMNGGKQFLLREQDLQSLIESVPGTAAFLDSGKISASELQKLPQIIEFNRYDVEFRGKKGICLFPEASYFNHVCIPNVEITISHDITEGFVLSARTCKPVEVGEELFINYIPGNDLPLSRLILAMRRRWGFECSCSACRSRIMGILFVYLIVIAIPVVYVVRETFEGRFQERARRLG